MSMFANLTRTRYIPKAKDVDSQTIYAVAGTDSKGRVSLGKAHALTMGVSTEKDTATAFFDDMTTVESYDCLKYFKNVKGMCHTTTDGQWQWGNSKIYMNALLSYCGKWTTYIGRYNFLPVLPRLVLPSFLGTTDIFSACRSLSYQCELIDIGPNCTYGLQDMYNFATVYDGNIVLRANRVIEKFSITPGHTDGDPCTTAPMHDSIYQHIFVPNNLLDEYKNTECYIGYEDKIYPIGGPTWKEIFGSTEPYADLTEEEKKWYTDLFPHLYDNWIAPENDNAYGKSYELIDSEGNNLVSLDGYTLRSL